MDSEAQQIANLNKTSTDKSVNSNNSTDTPSSVSATKYIITDNESKGDIDDIDGDIEDDTDDDIEDDMEDDVGIVDYGDDVGNDEDDVGNDEDDVGNDEDDVGNDGDDVGNDGDDVGNDMGNDEDDVGNDEDDVGNDGDDVGNDMGNDMGNDEVAVGDVFNLDNIGNGSEDDNSYSDSEDDNYQKIDKEMKSTILSDLHPELNQQSYGDILALSKIVRNRKGYIVDPLHKTVPFITKYESTRVIGIRAKQLNNGAESFIPVGQDMIDGYTIAVKEFEEKKIPFIICRPLPNGAKEYWKISDLEIVHY
jgi:DNA-directed RNA polymerase subunit K/omega